MKLYTMPNDVNTWISFPLYTGHLVPFVTLCMIAALMAFATIGGIIAETRENRKK